MHELGITSNIIAIVGDAAKGRRVARVTLEVGTLSGVLSAAIAFCFEAVAKGTRLDGATLEIREIEGRARYLDCGVEFAAPTLCLTRACGSRRTALLGGQELKIKTMELEEAA